MYTTSGFILRKYDAGEDDRSYIVYTKDYGKKNLFCKGARKIKSKLSPNLAEFAEINLDFVKGKRYDKITGSQIEKQFSDIRDDLRKIVIVSFCMDVVDNMIKAEHPDKEIYNLIREILEIIEEHKNIRKAYFSANIFVWKLLIILGYKPELDKCALCGTKLSELYFNKGKCELVCGECFSKRRISDSNLDSWRIGNHSLKNGREGEISNPFDKLRTSFKFQISKKDQISNDKEQNGGGETIIKWDGAIRRSSLEYLKGNPMAEVNFEEIIFIVKSFMRLHLEKVLKSEVWIDKLF